MLAAGENADEDEQGGEILGGDAGDGDAEDAPLTDDDEKKIEPDVQDARQGKIEERAP